MYEGSLAQFPTLMKLLAHSDDAPTRKMAAPPVSIACLACHGQYFAASLPIHQKACFQRNPDVLVPCEKCKGCVRARDFHDHAASCLGELLSSDDNEFMQPSALVQRAPMGLNLPEADGRVRCKLCERAFSQDRISKHQSVCHGQLRSEPVRRKDLPVVQRRALSRPPVKQPTEHRKTFRALASRPREVSFELIQGNYGPGSTGNWASRGTTARQSCQYPGAQAMQGGGCDTSNATSTSNPLATNPLMTMPR